MSPGMSVTGFLNDYLPLVDLSMNIAVVAVGVQLAILMVILLRTGHLATVSDHLMWGGFRSTVQPIIFLVLVLFTLIHRDWRLGFLTVAYGVTLRSSPIARFKFCSRPRLPDRRTRRISLSRKIGA